MNFRHRFGLILTGLVLILSPALGLFGQSTNSAPVTPPQTSVQPTPDSDFAPPTAPPTPPDPQPLLSPEQRKDLFDSIDLSLPALTPVRDAVAKGDLTAASHQLAQYFRNRTNVAWTIDPHHLDHTQPYDKVAAEDAAAGRITGTSKYTYAFPDGNIVWHFNLTMVDKKLVPNNGWQGIGLARMTFWDDLAKAYRATGDERYAKAWAQQLRSFFVQAPPPLADPGPDKAAWAAILPLDPNVRAGAEGTIKLTIWETIDSGIRMMASWPDSYSTFLLSPSISDEDILVYVYLCMEHGRHLHTYNTAGNWLTMEMKGLFTIGAFFPEFKESTEWRKYAVQRMVDLEKVQFLPDGAHEELSTGYGLVAVGNITGLYDVAKQTGHLDELPPDYLAPLEKAFEYTMYLTAPDRQIPQFNDSWASHVGGYMHTALGYFPNRQDFLWFATDGKQGHAPAETSHADAWAGFYIMRSGWDYHANYLVLRAGPLGASHSHQDKLNLVMWAFGRELLFNSGGGTYDNSKWRQYSVETFSKNSVVIDGLSQNRDWKNRALNISHAPIDARWESTPDHDFAAGIYNEGYGAGLHPATHSRRVLFLKPDLAIVSDTLTPNDTAVHTYQARWNLVPTVTRKIDTTGEVMTTDANQANLDLVPLNPTGLDVRTASGQTEPELLGWRVFHSGEAKPATTVVYTRKGAGVQSFLTLLVPLSSGVSSRVKSVNPTGPGTAEVLFTDGSKLAIAASADPAGIIEATETLADGKPGRHVTAGASK